MKTTALKPLPHQSESNLPAVWAGRTITFLSCGLLILAAGLVGCASGDYASAEATAEAGSRAYSQEVLHEGDLISITCESVPEITTTNKIPINGRLDLVFIGQVEAAGKTTRQFQEDLVELYSKQTRAEVINVQLIQSSASVYVGGAVLRPGKILLDRPLTALEAIMEAGGYDPNRAQLSKVTVVRVKDGVQTTYRLDMRKAFTGQDSTPFYLQPYDTVQVPNRSFNW